VRPAIVVELAKLAAMENIPEEKIYANFSDIKL
jgi:hypothetical protein